jgi:L-fuconolactonase
VIVDAHHHLWDPERRAYPWMTGPFAALSRRRTADDLRAVAGPAGVGATVAVQAATTEEETAELLEVAARDPLVAGVVGWVPLDAPDVAQRIAALRERPGGDRLVGLRHPVQDEPDPDWLGRDDVRRGLPAVADAGLVYDLLVKPQHLAAADAVARAVPQLTLVVDHGAKPAIAAGEWEPWSSGLARLAAHEQVHCKLSGLVTEARWDGWEAVDIGRYGARILDLFSPSRLMFGSDWPVCLLAASYAEVVDLAQNVLAGLSAGERADVLEHTARRVYGLAPSR